MYLFGLLYAEVFTSLGNDLIPSVVHCLLCNFFACSFLFLTANLFKLFSCTEMFVNQVFLRRRECFYAFDFITQEYKDEITTKSLETEEKVTDIDPMQKFPVDLWKALNKSFQEMVKACGYPSNPTARIDKDSLDAVVNEKAKENEGKGYRAFLNTIMLFNLMKLLESNGKYSLHMLFLDSPILSLKEKETVNEFELATPGMRESLFKYIISHCGENQIIIIENELPPNVDYRTAPTPLKALTAAIAV